MSRHGLRYPGVDGVDGADACTPFTLLRRRMAASKLIEARVDVVGMVGIHAS